MKYFYISSGVIVNIVILVFLQKNLIFSLCLSFCQLVCLLPLPVRQESDAKPTNISCRTSVKKCHHLFIHGNLPQRACEIATLLFHVQFIKELTSCKPFQAYLSLCHSSAYNHILDILALHFSKPN